MSKTHKDKVRHLSKNDVRWLTKGGPHKPKPSRQKLKEELLDELEEIQDEDLQNISKS